jgi:hypothetical protein
MKPSLGSAKGRDWRRSARAVSGVSAEDEGAVVVSRDVIGTERSSGVWPDWFRCDFQRRYAMMTVAERDLPIALQSEYLSAS